MLRTRSLAQGAPDRDTWTPHVAGGVCNAADASAHVRFCACSLCSVADAPHEQDNCICNVADASGNVDFGVCKALQKRPDEGDQPASATCWADVHPERWLGSQDSCGICSDCRRTRRCNPTAFCNVADTPDEQDNCISATLQTRPGRTRRNCVLQRLQTHLDEQDNCPCNAADAKISTKTHEQHPTKKTGASAALQTYPTKKTAASAALQTPPDQEDNCVCSVADAKWLKLLETFGAYELVGPVVAFEGPVLFVVFQEARRVERIDGVLREKAVVDGFDFDLE